ncbi:amino acid permease [Aeromicrobium sp. A1-2]|uniref:amino acid permease n=1 Tax=Aeromicrobium sp. A1-2 TaxID=2107713 RepID=UPI0013C2DB9B|nr:amino acid permease [Aeromicrobium sp. A1-2]
MLRITNARHRLPAVFGTGLLIVLALGVMIGAGIFSLAGQQAASMAGPAVIISFLIAAVVCVLAALSYAELSSTLPTAGGVYTFAYVAFGEVWAWIVGWALVLELVVAAALVSRVWAAYFTSTLGGLGIGVPAFVADHSSVTEGTGWIAALLVIVLALLVAAGTKLSGRVLTGIVAAKLIAVALVIVIGAGHVKASNYAPFVPDVVTGAGARGSVLQSLTGGTGDAFGLTGIFTAAGVIVFAFIGFDLIATAAEDTRNPRRSIPRAMLGAIGIVTVLYVVMATVLVGLRPYQELGTDAPVSDALRSIGPGWSSDVINIGALFGLTTVVLVVLIAQSRVLFAMGRDGLLPRSLSHVGTGSAPARAALVAGLAAALLALDPGTANREQLLVLGTLFAFGFCAVGVIRLRKSQPDLERGFMVPMVPFLPIVSLVATIWLSFNLSWTTWRNFVIWMIVGLLVYGLYGRGHSALGNREELPPAPEDATDGAAVSERQPGAHRAGYR